MENRIIVSKFGGSSLADFEAMKRSAHVVNMHQTQLVVVSATYGTTNQLLELIDLSLQDNWKYVTEKIEFIENRHLLLAKELNLPNVLLKHMKDLITELGTLCQGIFFLKECSPKAKDRVQSLGERISSTLFTQALRNEMPKASIDLLDVRKILKTDGQFTKASPITDQIIKESKELKIELESNGNRFYVTQGFIGSNSSGDTTTLGRGGSDYSASILGEALAAKEIQIWTDVAGIKTTDPKVCNQATRIAEISFKEAAEMATFGAKILHPTTLTPAKRSLIPVFVGSSYEPDAPGTWIRNDITNPPLVRAITTRSNQGLLTISNPEMLQAHGFLANIFKVFEKFDISVDAITTSEISVAMTVNQDVLDNKDLIEELGNLGNVKTEDKYALVSVIGNKINQTSGLANKIFDSLGEKNVRMICQGASVHNFCFLINEKDSNEVINGLHSKFIQ